MIYKGQIPLLEQPKLGSNNIERIFRGSQLVYGNPAPSLDPDAQAFLTATSITDPTITTAINDLVVTLKGLGLYTRFQALYPFVGGTATTHKFNLINPLDTDAAFRLTFGGTVTHNSNGITNSGLTLSGGITHFTPSVNFTLNNAHMSIYSRTNITQNSYDMGALTGTFDTALITSGFSNRFFASFGTTSNYTSIVNADSTGHFISNRDPAVTANSKGYRNGSLLINAVQAHQLPTLPIGIGGSNRSTGLGTNSTRNYAFSSIGFGFSDSEAASFTTTVQTFQTTLGRQV
jgi:hypothetical protein